MRLRGVPMCLDDGRRTAPRLAGPRRRGRRGAAGTSGGHGAARLSAVDRDEHQSGADEHQVLHHELAVGGELERRSRPWSSPSARPAAPGVRPSEEGEPGAPGDTAGRRSRSERRDRSADDEDGPDQPLGPADVRRVPSASRPRPGRPRRRLPKRRPQTAVPSATRTVVAAPVRGPPRRELRTTRTSSGPGVRDSTTARRRNSQRSPMRPRLRTRRPGPRSQGPPGRASGQDRPVLCWAETPLRVLDARPATADGRKST